MHSKLHTLNHNYFLAADEFDDDEDDVDGEFIPLTGGVDDGFFTPKPREHDDTPKVNPDRRIVPAGYYPQWPTYYPEVMISPGNA